MKYFFAYHTNAFGLVSGVKFVEDKGTQIGSPVQNIIQKFEITEEEFDTLSIFDLKAKYEI